MTAADARRDHRVGGIRFGPGNGPSYLECTCGWARAFDRADELPDAWTAHRLANGARKTSISATIGSRMR